MKLTPVIDSILAMPVVGDKLKPLVEELRTKMNTRPAPERGPTCVPVLDSPGIAGDLLLFTKSAIEPGRHLRCL